MKAMKRSTALVLLATFLSLQVHPAAFADDSDIFGANIQPNVLILFDSSGSMDDEITSEAYAYATTYTVVDKCGRRRDRNCDTNAVYQRTGSNRYELFANSVNDVNSNSAKNALANPPGSAPVGYWSGTIGGNNYNLFLGNYLNFQLGVCASGGCQEKKIDIAKRVTKDLISSVTGVRFGVMKFVNNGNEGQGGCGMVGQVGSSINAMKTAIDNINPSGYTPLGECMDDAGRYYKGQALRNGNTYTTPIQLSCQPNFVIMITDGLQNGSVDVRTEATNRKTQDHATSGTMPGLQNVIVDTVGFGIIDPTENAAANGVLQTAATNGGGTFYYANNSAELEAALQAAISRILQATFTFATPVVPTTTTTGSSRAYLAAFQSSQSSPFWQGYLKAYNRDAQGLIPVDANNKPLDSALAWEAGQVLTTISAGSRTIYTAVGAGLQAFTTGNSAITTGMLGVTTTADRDEIINFVRGVDVNDEDKDGNVTEDRPWKLGDIFHSTPVLVTPPVRGLADQSYQAFKLAKASRPTVVIAGANDGMLHAFRESDGHELWAFIPPDLLGTLKDVSATSGQHSFFVDSSPIAMDIKVGTNWKTIVVFGLRRGGHHYYALDITDTTAPQYMWSFTDPNIGETWSEPAMGKVKIGTSDKWAMFVGGGYNTGTNNDSGKAFFVVDLENGGKLWEYYNNSASDDRQYMNFSIASNPTAVDLDNNGYVDRVYVGDVGGQLWKFDTSATATSSWTGKRLFAASPGQQNPPVVGEYYPAQGFYGAPALTFDSNNNLWVFIGSGDRNHPNNAASNRFYGIKDNTDMTNGTARTESDLANVTGADATDTDGWFFALSTTDSEKVLAAANVFNKAVLFTTFAPTSTVTCSSGGGTAKLYAVQMQTGYAAINFSTGQALTTTNHAVGKSTSIGTGIGSLPVVVVTPPAGSGDATANAVTLTTDQQAASTPLPGFGFMKQVRAWRERIQ
jgi:type IV pilus assembly protein PilY1